jgi:formylglycine-generating enzyme required for sulfatase activity
MKTIMKMVLGSLAAGLAVCALATDPAISQVTVRQRWPWSRLVDIDYVLACDPTQEVDVAVSAHNGSTALTLPSDALSGDLYGVSEGAHRIVFDPLKTVYTNSEVMTQFSVTLTQTAVPVYLVIDLSDGTTASSYPVTYHLTAEDVPGGVTNDLYKTTSLIMRRIPSGTYKMGGGVPAPLSITLTKPFYIGVYEITQTQWRKVYGTSYPATFVFPESDGRLAAGNVAYATIRGSGATSGAGWPTNSDVLSSSFIGKMRQKTGLTGIDLPTSAQWEGACRAETTSYFNDGLSTSADTNILNQLAWWQGNSGTTDFPGGQNHVVGLKEPNRWGLYDMHGNVFEWCLDWAGNLQDGITDPKGSVSGTARIIRGGSYYKPASECSSSAYAAFSPSGAYESFGFRIVMTLP